MTTYHTLLALYISILLISLLGAFMCLKLQRDISNDIRKTKFTIKIPPMEIPPQNVKFIHKEIDEEDL